ncbi:hypothetical protein MUN88_06345 [Gracilibacillus caseinilyticus]|uniref:Uncharacterized protein n=1 Tax=Gracilibacillus caseinilyticus TaxID=2932256 RepID=A0ABY4EZJ1_9BACI|nr:hypothetical protein [Gracilibacillus caseinilyticus]UOQ49695.1 hypothetical protein MUN88_06345 [Gracilibacillus caseinilyticus]
MSIKASVKGQIPYWIVFSVIIISDLLFKVNWINAYYVFIFALGYCTLMLFDDYRKATKKNNSTRD